MFENKLCYGKGRNENLQKSVIRNKIPFSLTLSLYAGKWEGCCPKR